MYIYIYIMNKDTIYLESHQIKPIKYIVGKCKDQHGLLLFHNMGTGKTLTILSLCMNFPEHKKIIILPENIKSVWVSHLKKLKISIKNFEFIFFEKINNINYNRNIENTILIIDESHNIIDIFNNMDDNNLSSNKIKLYKWLQSSYKTFCLSGTPVYNNFSDLIYQINIVAGKDILPTINDMFYKKYTITNPISNFIYGWFLPIFRTGIPLFGTFSTELAMVYVKPAISNYFYNNIIFFGKYTSITAATGSIGAVAFQLWPIIISFLLLMLAKNLIWKINNLKKINAYKLVKKIGPYISYYKNDNKNDTTIIQKYPNVNESIVGVEYNTSQISLWINTVSGQLTYDDLNLLSLDNNYDNEKIFGNINSSNDYLYKGRIIGNLYFNENNKIIFSNKFIKVLSNIYEYDYDYLKTRIESYTKKLKALNICEQNINKIKHIDSKKNKLLKLEKTKINLIENIKIKKQKLNDLFNSKEPNNSVVYSNFREKGIILFKEFLEYFDIKYIFYDSKLNNTQKEKILQKFKNSKYCINKNKNSKNTILLLDPIYIEGISINGANQLHILEPLFKLSTINQLKARVVRYESHIHLEKEKRFVNIYQYYSSCETFYDNIIKISKKYKNWVKNEKHVIYFERYKKFNQDVTPDNIVLSNTVKIEKDLNLVINELKKNEQNINYNNIDCEPWYPHKDYDNENLACYHYFLKNKK